MNTETTTGLITASVTNKTVLDFISNKSKPSKLKPIDVLHLAFLMLRKAEDHGITDSNLTLSQNFNCDLKTIVRSRKRLVDAGYITAERRKGRSSATSINIANVPDEAALRSKLTPEAKSLTVFYMKILRRFGTKKFPKHFLSNQTTSAQHILDRCEGDVQLAEAVISFAVHAPQFNKSAKKSLYVLRGKWKKVKSAFDAANAVVPIAATAPVPTVQPLPPPEMLLPPPKRRVKDLRWIDGVVKYSDDPNGSFVPHDEVLRLLAPFDLAAWGDTFIRLSTGDEVPRDEALRLIEKSEEGK